MRLRLFVTCLLLHSGVSVSYGVVKGAVRATAPNVLFITVDDPNDWAGYNWNEQMISLTLDKLASEGVWFSNAYCQYPAYLSIMGRRAL